MTTLTKPSIKIRTLSKKKHMKVILPNLVMFSLIVVLAACGGQESTTESVIASGDLEQIRAKKKELTDLHKSIGEEISLLDSIIGTKVENRNLPLITTFTAEVKPFDHFVELQGDVTTKQNVLIYPEMAGTLIKVNVREGQSVSKGQLLATIDDGGMYSQLAQMETQLALAKTTYERQERLWEQKIGSEIQYLQAKSAYEAQKSAVNQMKGQLEKFQIRAPFSGIIDDVIKDQGTVVAPAGPGSEVFRIINLSEMYVEVDVPETYLGKVTAGKKVKVYLPIINEQIDSKVRETGNYIKPDNRSFTAEIPVPNASGKVKPNLTAKVSINDYSSKAAILIPQSIISENAEGDQYVYVASGINADNVAQVNRVIITTGQKQGDLVEVLTGLNNGDNLVLEGARAVKDGQQVKILTN
jgi:RND family efflux transporter MFP subunit